MKFLRRHHEERDLTDTQRIERLEQEQERLRQRQERQARRLAEVEDVIGLRHEARDG